jgi:peptidylprolyl isomerase domain and WD repeat-containing protein 1
MPELEAAADEAAVEEGPPKPPQEPEEDEDVGPQPPKAKKRKASCSAKLLTVAPDLCQPGCVVLFASAPCAGFNQRMLLNYIMQVLQFEQQYLDALPSAQMYETSYMHRDTVTHVVVSSSSNSS